MADITPALTAVAAPATMHAALSTSGTFVTLFGFSLNVMALIIFALLAAIIFMFYKIQLSEKLDFTDMLTKDGRAVSLTKVLQLIGGITGTWIMIKLTLTGGLTEALFGLYLTYVGAIEGYSKYVAAKYNYTETSVKDAK